eukprot:gene55079-12862_t
MPRGDVVSLVSPPGVSPPDEPQAEAEAAAGRAAVKEGDRRRHRVHVEGSSRRMGQLCGTAQLR